MSQLSEIRRPLRVRKWEQGRAFTVTIPASDIAVMVFMWLCDNNLGCVGEGGVRIALVR